MNQPRKWIKLAITKSFWDCFLNTFLCFWLYYVCPQLKLSCSSTKLAPKSKQKCLYPHKHHLILTRSNYSLSIFLSYFPWYPSWYFLITWFYCCAVLICFGCVQVFAIPWTVACQSSLSMGFSRQGHWSGLPCPSPKDFMWNFLVFPWMNVHYGKW